MDIFIISSKNLKHIDDNLLEQFLQRNISDKTKRAIHCLSYLMLDRILKNIYNIENPEIIFYGKKPFLKDRKIFFSISHSHNLIAIAFSQYDCGIDIELLKLREFEAISKRMQFNCNTLEDFYSEWTKYEAEYKLGKPAQKIKKFRLENYIMTATSVNSSEDFQVFIET